MADGANKRKTDIMTLIRGSVGAGAPSGKFKHRFRIRAGETKRIRFISDLTYGDTIEVKIHWSWQKLFPTPCQSYFGRSCPYCGDEDYETAEWYALTVRDLDQKELKVFAYSASSWSPIPLLIERSEEYGTLTDRPYKITKRRGQQDVSWDLVPKGGKRTWKKQYKPFTAEEVYEVLNAGRKIKAANGNGRP